MLSRRFYFIKISGDALTIIYTSPMFTMLFSFLFLRIQQGLWKISCACCLMVGVILVVRPPFLFPKHTMHLQIQENNQTFLAQDYSLKDEDIHWIGVTICFAASCICGLIIVLTRYLKVCSRFWANILLQILKYLIWNNLGQNLQNSLTKIYFLAQIAIFSTKNSVLKITNICYPEPSWFPWFEKHRSIKNINFWEQLWSFSLLFFSLTASNSRKYLAIFGPNDFIWDANHIAKT